MTDLQTADYVILSIVVITSGLGLFRGLSGTLAFILALAAGIFCGAFAWGFSGERFDLEWLKVVITAAVAILSFGLVRVIVKKTVNVLLAQPADAIFGLIGGIATGALVVAAWAYVGEKVHADYPSVLDCSVIATRAADYV